MVWVPHVISLLEIVPAVLITSIFWNYTAALARDPIESDSMTKDEDELNSATVTFSVFMTPLEL